MIGCWLSQHTPKVAFYNLYRPKEGEAVPVDAAERTALLASLTSKKIICRGKKYTDQFSIAFASE